MISRRAFLSLGGAAAGLGTVHDAVAAGAGQVTQVTGKAVAVAAAAERTLAVGAPIQVGDVVQTAAASRLALQLGTDTFINLGPSSKLRIEQHIVDIGGQFELIDGSVLMEHARKPGAPPHKAELRSPYGLIAVRGTRFFAGPSRGRFGIFVDEGRVDVVTRQRTVVLHPGYGSDIARPGDPATPSNAWGAPRIREAYQLTTGLTLPPRGR